MLVLVIPDVHLKPHIFSRAKEIMKKENIQTAVCLMDLPDDWNKQFQIEEYAATYDAAICFAEEYPNSLWCYGNHDLSYLWGKEESGYSSLAQYTVRRKLQELEMTLSSDQALNYIQVIDNVIFCHGGLSQEFVKKYVPMSKYDDLFHVIHTINSLGVRDMWKDDSPIWCRPQYSHVEMYKSKKYLQVVGHTPVETIYRRENVISCDVFSTYQDGTPIGTEEYLLLDTVTWEYKGIK